MAMFDAPETKFDAYRAMQEKKIVIVDTSWAKLGDDGSTIFGRYILAQCLAAAWRRTDKDHLALIVVDEAKTYLDEHSKKFLSDTRAFNVGLLLDSQFADQLDEGVRSEVATNTTVKFAGPAAYSVVSKLNRDMRTEVDFIMSMKNRAPPKDQPPYWAEWACYIDNVTDQAIRLRVPFGAIEKLPQISQAEWEALRRKNRERYGANAEGAVTGAPSTPSQEQGSNKATVPHMSDMELVMTTARRCEALVQEHYGATGRGLGEKLKSIRADLPHKIYGYGRYINEVRNGVAHEHGYALSDREMFLRCARLFEAHFAEPATKRPASEDHVKSRKPSPDDRDTEY